MRRLKAAQRHPLIPTAHHSSTSRRTYRPIRSRECWTDTWLTIYSVIGNYFVVQTSAVMLDNQLNNRRNFTRLHAWLRSPVGRVRVTSHNFTHRPRAKVSNNIKPRSKTRSLDWALTLSQSCVSMPNNLHVQMYLESLHNDPQTTVYSLIYRSIQAQYRSNVSTLCNLMRRTANTASLPSISA